MVERIFERAPEHTYWAALFFTDSIKIIININNLVMAEVTDQIPNEQSPKTVQTGNSLVMAEVTDQIPMSSHQTHWFGQTTNDQTLNSYNCSK